MFATHTYNRNSSRHLNMKLPYEVLYKRRPDRKELRVFGCKSFPFLHVYQQSKLNNKSKPCIFVRYASNIVGYLCLDLANRRVFILRDVYFFENDFSLCNKLFSNCRNRDKDIEPHIFINVGKVRILYWSTYQ